MSQPNSKIDFTPAEMMTIDDLETLKVIADPLRLQILELMEKPSTVKQVATKLETVPTKLYYHINLLDKHDLITLVETRVVSGIIEKHYQTSAKQVKVAKHLLQTGDDPDAENATLTIGTLLDKVQSEMIESLQARAISNDEDTPHTAMHFNMAIFHLTEEQAGQLSQDLDDLFHHYQQRSQENKDNESTINTHRAQYLLFPKKPHQSTD